MLFFNGKFGLIFKRLNSKKKKKVLDFVIRSLLECCYRVVLVVLRYSLVLKVKLWVLCEEVKKDKFGSEKINKDRLGIWEKVCF